MNSNKINKKKVLVIGSGPIIIGQAAEFDYAGTQACKSLKEEGIEVVLLHEPLNLKNFDPWIDKISSVVVSPGIDWAHITLKELRRRKIY